MELLVILLVVVVGGVLWYFSWYAQQQRKEAVKAFAAQQGWRWAEQDHTYVDRWDGKPFGEGGSRRARNVVTGDHRGRPVIAFDYTYTTQSGSGKNRSTQTHEYAVWAVQLPVSLPRIEVGSEGLFGGRVAKTFGFGDLELESEAFNREFRVKCDDQRFGMALIHPPMMELLMQTGAWPWRIDGPFVLSYEDGYQDPPQILARLDLIAAVLDEIPQFVWKDYGRPNPGGGTPTGLTS